MAAQSPRHFLVCLLVNTHQVSTTEIVLIPAGKRKKKGQARTEGEVSTSPQEFRAKTPMSSKQPCQPGHSKNRLGLPTRPLLGSKGRFLLYSHYVPQSLPRPLWWGGAAGDNRVPEPTWAFGACRAAVQDRGGSSRLKPIREEQKGPQDRLVPPWAPTAKGRPWGFRA